MNGPGALQRKRPRIAPRVEGTFSLSILLGNVYSRRHNVLIVGRVAASDSDHHNDCYNAEWKRCKLLLEFKRDLAAETQAQNDRDAWEEENRAARKFKRKHNKEKYADRQRQREHERDMQERRVVHERYMQEGRVVHDRHMAETEVRKLELQIELQRLKNQEPNLMTRGVQNEQGSNEGEGEGL